MDEIKTNPPVQNSPAEPPKKVRRVGTMAFAVLLIAGGVLLLAQQFMPKANLLAVLKFAPVILIVLGIEGTETFDIEGIEELNNGSTPKTVKVTATKENGEKIEFDAVTRIDTPGEADYYRNGGILQFVLRNMMSGK